MEIFRNKKWRLYLPSLVWPAMLINSDSSFWFSGI